MPKQVSIQKASRKTNSNRRLKETNAKTKGCKKDGHGVPRECDFERSECQEKKVSRDRDAKRLGCQEKGRSRNAATETSVSRSNNDIRIIRTY